MDKIKGSTSGSELLWPRWRLTAAILAGSGEEVRGTSDSSDERRQEQARLVRNGVAKASASAGGWRWNREGEFRRRINMAGGKEREKRETWPAAGFIGEGEARNDDSSYLR